MTETLKELTDAITLWEAEAISNQDEMSKETSTLNRRQYLRLRNEFISARLPEMKKRRDEWATRINPVSLRHVSLERWSDSAYKSKCASARPQGLEIYRPSRT